PAQAKAARHKQAELPAVFKDPQLLRDHSTMRQGHPLLGAAGATGQHLQQARDFGNAAVSRNMASPWGGNLPAIQGSEWADVLPVDWSQVPPILSLTDFPLIAGGVGALAAPSGHRLE